MNTVNRQGPFLPVTLDGAREGRLRCGGALLAA
jgi:hypothetical protein